jgi:tRNA G37 N-methylase Trm5
VLPEGEIPSSFETIGHIAHINLRDVHLPFKNLIGEVILQVFTGIAGLMISEKSQTSHSCK